ncbi:Carboxypeptidase A4 [Colletotrichum spinosum]|uniref:Carboxypeptidase A4 n=1 Tax=Colletotrichum spinosum TaxID=1347390 RepID=A0A4R8QHN1_9PEZI|nr:Carboxypeptidase A4 [Colletotrichum spinosum]
MVAFPPINPLWPGSWWKLILLITSSPKWYKDLSDQRPPNSAPISEVNRFSDWTVNSVGLGTTSTISDPRFNTILTEAEVESALRGLQKTCNIKLSETPNRSYWGHKSSVVYIPPITALGPGKPPRKPPQKPKTASVLITSGFHGRERGGPDSLVYFLTDLLHAYVHRRGLQYGNRIYSKWEVAMVLELGIVILPVVNPDGLAWDQQFHSCWGNNLNFKNRRSKNGNVLDGIGVNIDRNFDVAWDFRRIYSPEAEDVSSDNPSHELYHGDAPFSEPESRNVAAVFEQHKDIRWYLNAGEKSRVVTHPWGIDVVQTTKPEQNWRNEDFDGMRGVDERLYGEYMDLQDLHVFKNTSAAIAKSIQYLQGKKFRDLEDLKKQNLTPLAASGTATDWAYSRHLVDDSLEKVYSFKLQVGMSDEEAHDIAIQGLCPFYPTSKQYKNALREAAVGYMEFLLEVAKHEDRTVPKTPRLT